MVWGTAKGSRGFVRRLLSMIASPKQCDIECPGVGEGRYELEELAASVVGCGLWGAGTEKHGTAMERIRLSGCWIRRRGARESQDLSRSKSPRCPELSMGFGSEHLIRCS